VEQISERPKLRSRDVGQGGCLDDRTVGVGGGIGAGGGGGRDTATNTSEAAIASAEILMCVLPSR